MNRRRLVAGHGYCLHELRPRHMWHDRQRDRRLRIAFATWHRSACDAALVRHQVTRVLGQRRQSLILGRCFRRWVAWTSQSAAMRTATAAAEMKASALPVSRSRKKGALKMRARSDKQGTSRATNLHSRRRKVRSRSKQTKRLGLQGPKAAESAKGGTADERGQEDDEADVVSEATEATDDEDFHSAEELDSCYAEADADQRVRLPPTVAAEHERLLELHKDLKGVLHQAEALESLAIQERDRALRWVRCHRYGRGEDNAEQQQEAAMASIHDAEREIKEARQCVESLEEMLHQDCSSAIELVVAMEEQAQRHLDHALGRVALAEHTARAERARAQRFMAAWLVGRESAMLVVPHSHAK